MNHPRTLCTAALRWLPPACAALALLSPAAPPLAAQAPAGQVLSDVLVSDVRGGFTGTIAFQDYFGSAVEALGDLDGDGVGDIAVAAVLMDFNFPQFQNIGGLWTLFLHADGSVKGSQLVQLVTDLGGGSFKVKLLGDSLGRLHDVDGDNIDELLVGGAGDPTGALFGGALRVLFPGPDGTIHGEIDISEGTGGFTGQLNTNDRFGSSVANLGDVNGDGVDDLAVGAPGSPLGAPGVVWILFMFPDGTVREQHRITEGEGGFTADLDLDNFGAALATLPDLDGNGVHELLVGAPGTDDGGSNAGAVWVLYLSPAGTVLAAHSISMLTGGFGGQLDAGDFFGRSIAVLDDLDGNGVPDLAVGAPFDDDGGPGTGSERGAVWILFMDEQMHVLGEQKISQTQGGFGGTLFNGSDFGVSVSAMGDLDGNGAEDLLVGADGSSSGFGGQAWLLYLQRAAWTWLGQGLAGVDGLPSLVGTGTLLGGDPMTLTLKHAAPSAALTLVAGLSQIGAPLKGGVLVPQPLILLPAATDAQGAWTLPIAWPTGIPAGVSIYLQAWIADAAGPEGFAASNAVVGTTP
jgi:hypothetical protein